MSRLYVDRISPYQSGSITIDGYDPTIDTGSFATTGSNTFDGNQIISGSITVNGVSNFGDDVKIDTGVSGNAALFLNPNFLSSFYGQFSVWQPNTNGGQSRIFVGEKALADIYVNAYSSSYDNMFKIGANSEGAFAAGINTSTFSDDVWLKIPSMGLPNFQRSINVSGSVTINEVLQLQAQDPLPAGAVGQLAVSGSDLYFHDGSTWVQK
jgi:hypothetical protein